MTSSRKTLTSSLLGLKLLMAVTGVILFGFIVGHMVGNLGVFVGKDSFNAYAHFLKSTPAILWPTRIVLLLAVLVHIVTAFKLSRINKKSRSVSYKSESTVQASFASLYMLELGIIILVFIFLHLAHFTLGYLLPEYYSYVDAEGRHDVYRMLVESFQLLPYAIGYSIAMIALGFHLSHGLSSFIQTLGIFHPRYTPCIRRGGRAFGLVIALGYISIPLAVVTGIVSL